jgi:hypothetical protein
MCFCLRVSGDSEPTPSLTTSLEGEANAKSANRLASIGLSGWLCGFDSTTTPRVGGRRPPAGPRAREAVTCVSLGALETDIKSSRLDGSPGFSVFVEEEASFEDEGKGVSVDCASEGPDFATLFVSCVSSTCSGLTWVEVTVEVGKSAWSVVEGEEESEGGSMGADSGGLVKTTPVSASLAPLVSG